MASARDEWERLPGETEGAYLRFRRWLDIGPGRSRAAFAKMEQVTVSAIDMMASEHGWVSRTAAWDAEVQRRADEATLKNVAKAQERHLEAVDALITRGLELVREGDGEAGDGTRMLSEGVKLHRLVLGAATARTETSLTSSVLAMTDDHLEALTDEERKEWRRLVEKMAAAVGDGDAV